MILCIHLLEHKHVWLWPREKNMKWNWIKFSLSLVLMVKRSRAGAWVCWSAPLVHVWNCSWPKWKRDFHKVQKTAMGYRVCHLILPITHTELTVRALLSNLCYKQQTFSLQIMLRNHCTSSNSVMIRNNAGIEVLNLHHIQIWSKVLPKIQPCSLPLQIMSKSFSQIYDRYHTLSSFIKSFC